MSYHSILRWSIGLYYPVVRFNFDKLCDSIGKAFMRFLEYYRKGLENRIITELKTAR